MRLDRDNCLGGHYNNRVLTGIRLRNYQIFPTDDLNVFTWSLKDSDYTLDTIRIDFAYVGCSCENHYLDFGDNSWADFEIPESAKAGDIVLHHNYANRDGQDCVIITCLVPSGSESGGRVYGLKTVEALSPEIIVNDHVKDLFAYCPDLESVDIRFGELFANVSDMSDMFQSCGKLKKITIPYWTTSTRLTNLKGTFAGCESLETIDVSNWNTSNVINMRFLFHGCESLTELDVSNWDTSNVTNMSNTFSGCSALTELDVSNFNTSNVTSIGGMFSGCTSLTELDLSNFNTSNVTSMFGMFGSCTSLTTLNLSGWNLSNVIYTDHMFENCTNLQTLILNDCSIDTISKMISSLNFPTGTINSGATRKIYCDKTAVEAAGLTEPDGWEFENTNKDAQ
jgi:surface protein